MSLTDLTNRLLRQLPTHTLEHQLQTEIHPEIHFRRNSINLLIGRRGSGKTYNVFREMIKLYGINDTTYTQFIYVTNKLSDDTFHKMKKLIKIPIIKCKYEDIEECIQKIIEAKEDYQEIVEKDLSQQLDDKYAAELMNTLSIKSFDNPILHTVVLYDDAIEIFRNRKSKLYRMLFENRQPKITYFLCIQDPIGLDPSIKSNLDSCWLFGGYSSQKFCYIFNQLNNPYDRELVFEKYKELTMNQAIIFDFSRTGTQLKLLLE